MHDSVHWKSYSYAPEGVARTPMGAWRGAVTRGHVYTSCVHMKSYSYAPRGVARTPMGAWVML